MLHWVLKDQTDVVRALSGFVVDETSVQHCAAFLPMTILSNDARISLTGLKQFLTEIAWKEVINAIERKRQGCESSAAAFI